MEKCEHKEWCNNRASWTVSGSPVCSVHLASACRFSTDVKSQIFKQDTTIQVKQIEENV